MVFPGAAWLLCGGSALLHAQGVYSGNRGCGVHGDVPHMVLEFAGVMPALHWCVKVL